MNGLILFLGLVIIWFMFFTGTRIKQRKAENKEFMANSAEKVADENVAYEESTMSFSEAVKICLKKLFCFKGRARRSEYWSWVLLNCIISLFIYMVGVLAFNDDVMFVVLIVLIAICSLLSFPVCVRRLHDIGKSGWALDVMFVPFVGWIFPLVWCFKDSQPCENIWGSNPKLVEKPIKPEEANV